LAKCCRKSTRVQQVRDVGLSALILDDLGDDDDGCKCFCS